MTKQASMHKETDEFLFYCMACADEPTDRPMADEAYTEIHRRYVKPLYARCLKMVSFYPDSETLAMDLTTAALSKAYDRAETYQPNPDGSTSGSRTIAWLCTIALNIFRDYCRNPERPGPINVVEFEVYPEDYASDDFAKLYCEGQPQLSTQAEYRLVAMAFDTLDTRTQIVLIETLVQRDRSPGRTYMLRGTSEQLAKRLGTTTANLRRIRKKGVCKINDYLDQHKQISGSTHE